MKSFSWSFSIKGRVEILMKEEMAHGVSVITRLKKDIGRVSLFALLTGTKQCNETGCQEVPVGPGISGR